MNTILRTNYPEIVIPTQFELDKAGTIKTKDKLHAYGWGIQTMTGFTPTPKEAHTLLTHMQPWLQSQECGMDSLEREHVLLDLLSYTGTELPASRKGTHDINMKLECIKEALTEKRAMFAATPENIKRMQRVALVRDLVMLPEISTQTDETVLSDYGMSKKEIRGRANDLIHLHYPDLTEREINTLVTNVTASSYPHDTKAKKAFIGGDIRAVKLAAKHASAELGR